ncbi:MAG TPA: glycosyltransferase family 4 protein [Croceibacterium sp.]|nr:glycosyltransferase family 4 protein [Croceibacterium sp.]
MKLALLVPGGVDRSGTDRVIPCLLWLIERLAAAGHEVHVFAAHQESSPASWPLHGATVHNIGLRPRSLRMLGLIAAHHRLAPFDVIHAFWSSLGAIGSVAAGLLRVPLVLTLPGGDVSRQADIGFGARLSWKGRLGLRLAARGAAAISTPSQWMSDLAATLGLDAAAVPLGVDLARWPPAPPRPRDPSQPFKLLHVASLNRVKDQPTLFEAVSRVHAAGVPTELVVAGCDTLDGEIQRLAARLCLAVRFVGELRHAELRPWFDWADLLVMSSRHEAGPLVTLEAAVAGVPTVGTRVGHIADLAPAAAVAVAVGDAPALAAAIATLAADEPRRLALAASAQAFAVRHDADFTAQAFLATYLSLAANRRQDDEPKGLLQGTTGGTRRGSGRMRG